MALITIEGMEFYAPIGHFVEEQIIGTHFEVDLAFETDTLAAEKSDNLKDTIDYSAVYRLVKRIMSEKCNLLEHVCHKIITALVSEFEGVESAEVKVSKLNPAMGGKMERVSVVKFWPEEDC
jgi:dihydroneopterin aldolase